MELTKAELKSLVITLLNKYVGPNDEISAPGVACHVCDLDVLDSLDIETLLIRGHCGYCEYRIRNAGGTEHVR